MKKNWIINVVCLLILFCLLSTSGVAIKFNQVSLCNDTNKANTGGTEYWAYLVAVGRYLNHPDQDRPSMLREVENLYDCLLENDHWDADHIHGELGDQTCFFSYQCDEAGTAWIYTLTDEPGSLNDATSTSMDIDQDTLYSYAVYNYHNQTTGLMDVYLFIMDFGQWGEYSGNPIHENTWEAFLTNSGNNNKLDVSAFKNNVIIVSERDGDIIAYYGDDPLQNDFSETTIIADAGDPRISHISENKAVCTFVKDGDLYYALTEDGGVTWTTQGQVSEEENVLSGDVCAYGYVYEAEETVYFAPTDFSQSILQIDSISGAIGVSAIVKNVGTAAAEDVDWSIVTEGTVFLGGEKSGQITLEPGETKTIKTGLMLGFGNIDVTVTLDTMTKTASGKLLLFFIIGLE